MSTFAKYRLLFLLILLVFLGVSLLAFGFFLFPKAWPTWLKILGCYLLGGWLTAGNLITLGCALIPPDFDAIGNDSPRVVK